MISNFAFGKSHRLLKADDFKAVFDQTSFKVHQPNLLFFVKKSELNDSRLGLAITKKKVKRANERNRLKRLVRENFRLFQHDFLMPVDVVVIVKQDIKLVSNMVLHEQIEAGFLQINIQLQKRFMSLNNV
ncbi:ribonuclease P protein component [Faucicola mancuniensis]|uniref:ribonuclease P protein component n=1 Tax=Faucicola mancuniensis TaxID=1309795 RepID=UPI0028E84990|nr:ribonuclease P protein component [uncultured Moraxella sp.]